MRRPWTREMGQPVAAVELSAIRRYGIDLAGRVTAVHHSGSSATSRVGTDYHRVPLPAGRRDRRPDGDQQAQRRGGEKQAPFAEGEQTPLWVTDEGSDA